MLEHRFASLVFALPVFFATVAFAEAPKPLAVYEIYADAPHAQVVPSGKMGQNPGLGVAVNSTAENPPPFAGDASMVSKFDTTQAWGGLAWLWQNSWGIAGQPLDLFKELKAKEGDNIRFRLQARSSKGAGVVFKFGGGDGSSMSFPKATKRIELTPEWKLIEIDLTGEDLSSLTGMVCCWTCVDRDQKPVYGKIVEFQIDSVQVVKLPPMP